MSTARAAALTLWTAFLALSCPQPIGAQGSPVVSLSPYLFEADSGNVEAEFGRLDVPEEYGARNRDRIKLAFVRFKSTAAIPGAPVVFLAGGPGSSAIAAARGPRFAGFMALRKFGDLILLDQRGTGLSEPRLDCPQPFSYPLERALNRGRITAALRRFAGRCAAFWKSQGVNLAAYNTEASADDLNSLCQALGIRQVRLIAASYGTHLALSTIRRHPEIVERAVLLGAEGPDHTIKLPMNVESHLTTVSELIAADPIAGKVLPDFQGLLKKLVVQLRQRPIMVSTHNASDERGEHIVVRLSAYDIEAVAASLLGRRVTIETIPRIFGPAVRGEFSAVASFVPGSVRTTPVSAMGAVMDCASGASKARWRTIVKQRPRTTLGTMEDFPLPEWCSAWGVPTLPDRFRTPVRARAPVLFIAGTLDGLTPVANALEIRQGFPNSTLLTVAGGGHDSLANTAGILDAIDAFLSGKNLRDQTFELPPLRFQLPN